MSIDARPNGNGNGGGRIHDPTKFYLAWNIGRFVARLATTLAWDLKVYGRHNVPAKGGVLLVSNHQSFLDPILIALHLDRPMSFMARHGLFTNPHFGWLIRQYNAFPIRQGEGDVGAVRETIRRLQEGHMLNIFPEGARTDTGELQPIQPGAALVIRKAAVPVVPVAIEGSYAAWPRGRKLPRSHPIRVMYGKPLTHLHEQRPAQIVQTIGMELADLLGRLRRMDHWERP